MNIKAENWVVTKFITLFILIRALLIKAIDFQKHTGQIKTLYTDRLRLKIPDKPRIFLNEPK